MSLTLYIHCCQLKTPCKIGFAEGYKEITTYYKELFLDLYQNFGYPTRTNDEKTERIIRLHKKICKKE